MSVVRRSVTVLADQISVHDRYARSANVERDVDRPEPLDGYVVTARSLEVVERIAAAAGSRSSGGAWSLTGPYGSGKSSLALLLDAAFGPVGPPRTLAWSLIDERSHIAGQSIRRAHEVHHTMDSGFHRALITANPEPIGRTLLRAFHSATVRRYGKIPSSGKFRAAHTLRRELEEAKRCDLRRSGLSVAAMIEIVRCLAEDAPILMIIDEFGKNLETIGDSHEADPYLLQQLAETGQGMGLPIFLLTLQHMSFEDHLDGAGGPRRREWAKVQGRFEDIAYVESAPQSRALIGTAFVVGDEKLRRRIARWARSRAKAMGSFGISEMADPEVVASCYPLHPLAAMLLPELCNRYGQHERTLFSFLAGLHHKSAASFLATTRLPKRGSLPFLGIDALYDYFVSGETQAAMSSYRLRRWTEIALRLRDLHGLSPRQIRLAKAIALLNLVSTGGTIRASSPVLSLIDADAADILASLEAAGLVTYRRFADEYRIWQGTDVDVSRLMEMARQKTRERSLPEILSDLDRLVPVVAARHSAQHDVLRVFSRRYVVGGEQVDPLDAFSPFDGEVLLVVDMHRKIPELARSAAAGKPVVAAIPRDLTTLDRVAREVLVVSMVLKDPGVESDWVARRELTERLAESQAALRNAIIATFGADACRWVLIDDSGMKELSAGRGSAALSEAADISYPSTPKVGNEMLNRTGLTSQGAKARRLLIEAMIENGPEADLGFAGYGPEMAMYRAFLAGTGLHDRETHLFDAPTDTSLEPAWSALVEEFERAKERRLNLKDIHAVLLLPPFGMKAGVIPVLMMAGLLAFRDEIAIYEHGTFRPLLTPELAERMVRNPDHFDIKHFANTTGARRQVVNVLARRLGLPSKFRKHRVRNVLSVVGQLVDQVRNLDNHTRCTRNLTSAALKVRDAIVTAVEPDELLFSTLPDTLGFRQVSTERKTYSKAAEFAESLGAALEEITGCHDRLLAEMLQLLLETSAETSRQAITRQAVSLDPDALSPSMRALVGTLVNDGVESDIDWISAVATVVVGKAPTEWDDDDLALFRREIPLRIAAFQRLMALHSERWTNGPGDALRVTITRPDGHEHVGLIEVDQRHQQQIDQALDEILRELGESIGSPHRAQRALLAVLGKRMLPTETPTKAQ